MTKMYFLYIIWSLPILLGSQFPKPMEIPKWRIFCYNMWSFVLRSWHEGETGVFCYSQALFNHTSVYVPIFGGFPLYFSSLEHWPLSRHHSSVTLKVYVTRSKGLKKQPHTARNQNVAGCWAKKGQPTADNRERALLATTSKHPCWSSVNERVCLWWLCCPWCQIIKDFSFLLNLLSLPVISFFKKIVLYIYNGM